MNCANPVGCAVIVYLWCGLAIHLAPVLDHALNPEEPSLSLHWPWDPDWHDSTAFLPNLAKRVHNTSALPIQCSNILQSDVVPDASEACLSWCRESLGPGSAMAYAFSPMHYASISLVHNYTSQFHVLKTCWKVETASWTLKWMPHLSLMYFYSLAYGSISSVMFLYRFKKCKTVCYSNVQPETSESSSSEETSKQPSWNLYLGVLSTLLEPVLDVLSVLTFLHNGQLYLASLVVVGLLLGFVKSLDPLQLKGARAAAESLRQGFASDELLQHKANEWIGTFFSTTVQVYALLILDVGAVQFFAAMNLLAAASFSLFISLPSQSEAAWISHKMDEAMPWQETFLAAVLPCLVALLFYLVLLIRGWEEAGHQWQILWAALVQPGHRWILAMLMLLFRAMTVITVLCVFPLFFSTKRMDEDSEPLWQCYKMIEL
eukprot:Skav208941  [mRNA]  locus=scaffold1880:141876:143171:+ [translate_table: standard]